MFLAYWKRIESIKVLPPVEPFNEKQSFTSSKCAHRGEQCVGGDEEEFDKTKKTLS